MKKEYKNFTGKITDVREDCVVIDGTPILTDTPRSRDRMLQADPHIGDTVDYNFNRNTGELIYMKITNKAYDIQPSDDEPCHVYTDGEILEDINSVNLLVPRGEMTRLSLASAPDPNDWIEAWFWTGIAHDLNG